MLALHSRPRGLRRPWMALCLALPLSLMVLSSASSEALAAEPGASASVDVSPEAGLTEEEGTRLDKLKRTDPGGWRQEIDARLRRRATPFIGRPVEAVVLGCDSRLCEDRQTYATLVRITRVRRGQALNVSTLLSAWLRLKRLFKSVQIRLEAQPDGGGVVVQFICVAHHTITRLDVRYTRWQSEVYPKVFAREIRKRIRFKRGGIWPEGDEESLERERRKIVEYYERLGYRGTSVRFLPKYSGADGREVELTIEVTEGDQPWIGEVYLKGHKALSYAKVVSVLSTGEVVDFPYLKPILGLFGIGRFEQRRLREELLGVERMYRDEGYFTARARLVEVVPHKDSVHPVVQVYEGPHVAVEFEGNTRLSDSYLRSQLTFAEAGSIDEAEIEASRLALREAYEAIGHYFVRIDIARPERVDPDVPDRLIIRIRVDEQRQVYVRHVHFKGNRYISDQELIEQMETQGLGDPGVVPFLGSSASILQEARLITDLATLRDYYRAKGFPTVSFRCRSEAEQEDYWIIRRLQEESGQTPDPEISRGRFDEWSTSPSTSQCYLVQKTRAPWLVDVTLELNEGERTTTERLDLGRFFQWMNEDWDDRLSDTLIVHGFMDEQRRYQRAGVNGAALQDVEGILLNWLHSQGFHDAVVRARCGYETEPDVSCRQEIPYGKALDTIYFEVEEGPKLITDGVLVDGNLRTDLDAILQELRLVDGTPLPTDDLFLSESNLRRLGIFESVKIETIRGEGSTANGGPAPGASGDAPTVASTEARPEETRNLTAVVVTVEESRNRLVEGSVGFQVNSSTLDDEIPVLYAVGLALRDRNTFGRALETGLRGEHANRLAAPQDVEGDNATFIVGPYLRDRSVAGTQLDFTLDLTWSRGLTQQRDRYAEIYRVAGTLSYDVYNLSYPDLWGRGLLATLRTEASREQRRNRTRAGERPPFGDPIEALSLGPGLRYDRRDSALHPTRGFLLEVAPEMVVSNAFSNLTAPAWKVEFQAQSVLSMFDRRLLVVPQLTVGSAWTDLTDDDLPTDFLFKAGGDRVAFPVRGYADASIEAGDGVVQTTGDADLGEEETTTPVPVGGRALISGSLELRFPTVAISDLWVGLFGDVGAVAEDWSAMSQDRFYPSFGVGLRYLVTGQIPVRLDVGFPMRETPFSPQTPRLHFNIFYTL